MVAVHYGSRHAYVMIKNFNMTCEWSSGVGYEYHDIETAGWEVPMRIKFEKSVSKTHCWIVYIYTREHVWNQGNPIISGDLQVI